MITMTWEYALALFILMLTAQVPLLILATVNYIKAKTNAFNIGKIEKATNSMKDALVKTTGESERAKGRIEGADEERNKNK